METKAEIQARLDELEKLDRAFRQAGPAEVRHWIPLHSRRKMELEAKLEAAQEDMAASVIRSHTAICRAKRMDEKAAYGQDPSMYYSLAICGEAGEMGNKIVKGLRNGNDPDASKRAVESELPDVFIYGFVLAHVLDIDIVALVNEKVDVVIQRAVDGYYGGPLPVPTLPAPPIGGRDDGPAR